MQDCIYDTSTAHVISVLLSFLSAFKWHLMLPMFKIRFLNNNHTVNKQMHTFLLLYSFYNRTCEKQYEREERRERERKSESPLGENTWPAEARTRGDERVWEQLFDSPLQSRNRRESLPEESSHLLYLPQQASGAFCTAQLFFSVLSSSTFSFSFYSPQRGKSPFCALSNACLK